MKFVCRALLILGILGLTSCGSNNPQVVMETSMGTVKMELYANQAPITVKNFLDYVDKKHYDGTIFHRVIPTFMIQGGGLTPEMKEKDSDLPIKNESYNGLQNKRGTLAMARKNKADSATDQFFINVTNNAFLDKAKAKDGVGYAVFGKVIEGMDVVDKIRGVKTITYYKKIKLPNGKDYDMPMKDVPAEPVIIKSIRRVQN